MSERKWKGGDFFLFHSDDGHPWIADTHLENVCWVRREDYARLIAAAPDLYEALKEAEDWMSNAMCTHLEFGLGDAPLTKARAALQRAEGEGQ